jgi:hypothetical protein
MIDLLRRIMWLSCCCLTLVMLGGCNSADNQSAIVQGTVTIDGELAHQGIVTFHPTGGGPVAYGPIRSDGSFTIQVGQGKVSNLDASQIQTGDYLVTVVVGAPPAPRTGEPVGPAEPGPRITAKKYSSKSTTDLKYSVKPGKNVFSLEVERATEEELAAEKSDDEAIEELVSDSDAASEGETDVADSTAEASETSKDEQAVSAESNEAKPVEQESVQP